ncbi:MAG: hypothetical protein ACXWQE_00145 [Bdellovibrionales bacterium]
MSIAFKLEFDPKIFIDQLKELAPDKWQKILSDASNETGFYVLNKYKQQMPNYIDRPTPFTLNSMFVKKSKPTTLDTSVQWKDWTGSGSIPAGKYLTPEAFGGQRRQKRFERALQAKGLIPAGWVAVPTKDAPKDSYGNVPGGYITKILSYLGASPDYQQNRQINRLKKMSTVNLIKGVAKTAMNFKAVQAKEDRAKKRAQKFFAVIKGRRGNPLPSGIYERANMTLGSAIKRVFNFVPIATYRVSFPFYEIGTEAANSKFPSKVAEAVEKSLKPFVKAP